MAVHEQMLKMIFLKTPPLQCLRLRQVSARWGELIDTLFEEENLWRQLCRSDIMHPWVYNITEIIFQNKKKDWSRPLLSKSWKKIFQFYNEWNINIRTMSLQVTSDFEEMDEFNEEITDIDMYDVFIATNYQKNRIVVLQSGIVNKPNSRTVYTISSLRSVSNNMQKIVKIKFWFTDTKQLILVVHCIQPLFRRSILKYFDVLSKKKIENPFRSQTNVQNFTCGAHRLFIATSETIYECMWKENRLTVGHTICAINTILTRNEIRQMKILEMCLKSDFKVDRLALLIKIAPDIVRVITLMLPRNEKRHFKKLDCDRDITIRREDSLFYIPMPGVVFIINDMEMIINLWYPLLDIPRKDEDQEDRIVSLRSSYASELNRDDIPRPGIQRSRSSSSSSSSVGGFRDNPLTSFKSTYRLLRSGKLRITSIFLFCNVLILGLQTGDLEIYHFKNIKALANEDFYSLPSQVINFCDDPIININIYRPRADAYYIIVTTPKAMHVQEFNSPEDLNETLERAKSQSL